MYLNYLIDSFLSIAAGLTLTWDVFKLVKIIFVY